MASHDDALAEIRRLREAIGDTIEGMIDILDALDAPHEDLEDDDPGGGNVEDEPQRDDGEDDAQLGWANEGRQTRLHGLKDEYEPSLGSLGGCITGQYFPQTIWAAGDRRDLEDEHDGREPDVDGEGL